MSPAERLTPWYSGGDPAAALGDALDTAQAFGEGSRRTGCPEYGAVGGTRKGAKALDEFESESSLGLAS